MKMSKVVCLGLAATLVLGMSVPAMAATTVGTSTFNGTKLVSTFDGNDFKDHAYDLLPGDSTELTVTIKNDSNDLTDWYLEHDIVNSLEDSVAASGGAYSYTLTYYNSENEPVVLYSSGLVGGDDTNPGVGLNQVDTASEDFFYLDRLTAQDTGSITLAVALDGETQGNAYQDSFAQLQLRLAVEKVVNNEITKKVPGERTIVTNTIQGPKTGDDSRLMLYSVMALAAGLILFLFFFMQKRRRDQEEKGVA